MIRILIADDHPVVRSGLKQILAGETDLAVQGEAQNGQEVLELVRKQKCDVLILDLQMPGRSGLDLLKELKHGYPELHVLVLSLHPEDQMAVRALKAGAAGYLTKESAGAELIKAIRKVSHGGKYVSPSLAERLATALGAGSEKPPSEILSDQEYLVMRLIASGKAVGEIAKELSLSAKTISTYRTRIMQKMGMKTNAELTHYAIRNKLID